MPLHDHSNDTYFRFPVQPNGLEEDKEDPAGPAIPGLEEADSSDQNSLTSQQLDDQGEKDQEALPQDLSMISFRHGDR